MNSRSNLDWKNVVKISVTFLSRPDHCSVHIRRKAKFYASSTRIEIWYAV
jgi:hypothetical protein